MRHEITGGPVQVTASAASGVGVSHGVGQITGRAGGAVELRRAPFHIRLVSALGIKRGGVSGLVKGRSLSQGVKLGSVGQAGIGISGVSPGVPDLVGQGQAGRRAAAVIGTTAMGAFIDRPIGIRAVGRSIVLGQGSQPQIVVLLPAHLVIKRAGIRVHLDDPVQGVLGLIQDIGNTIGSRRSIGLQVVLEGRRIIPISRQEGRAAPGSGDHELDEVARIVPAALGVDERSRMRAVRHLPVHTGRTRTGRQMTLAPSVFVVRPTALA